MQTLMKLCLNGFVGFYVIRFNMLSDAFLMPVLTKRTYNKIWQDISRNGKES